jgi:hypothetical protein
MKLTGRGQSMTETTQYQLQDTRRLQVRRRLDSDSFKPRSIWSRS